MESTQNIHKHNGNSHFSAKETESASHKISGRYFDNSGLEGRNESSTEPVNISPAVTRFFDKYKEIDSPVPTVDKIWGIEMNLVEMTEISNCNSVSNSFGEVIRNNNGTGPARDWSVLRAIAVLLAPLLYCAIQRKEIMKLAKEGNYKSQITLTEEVKGELN